MADGSCAHISSITDVKQAARRVERMVQIQLKRAHDELELRVAERTPASRHLAGAVPPRIDASFGLEIGK